MFTAGCSAAHSCKQKIDHYIRKRKMKYMRHIGHCGSWVSPFSHDQGCWTSLSNYSRVKCCLAVPYEMQSLRAVHAIPQFIGASSTFWGQAKWHILSSEKSRSAVQQFVPLAGASMSKVLKLVIFSAVPSAVQACSAPTPNLIKFIGSDYELG